MGEVIIIAPHGDDEIIGTYRILSDPNLESRPIIIYTEEMDHIRKVEATKLRDNFDIKIQMYLRSIPANLLIRENTFYIPDPIYETHPAHRLQGAIGEQMVRGGYNVIFYCTNMSAPYCHEVKDPGEKERLLNEVYPSQKSLWKHEKKYILFEGYNKWII